MDKYCKLYSAMFSTEPFTFNTFINDLFFFSGKCEICCFACDNSLYSCGIDLDNTFTNIIQDTWRVYEWFVYSSMKAHPENFQFIILENAGLHTLETGDITTKWVSSVTLLGITIDWKLDFKEDINNIIKKHIINYIP